MYVKSAEWRKSFAESEKSEFENITKIPKLEQAIEVFQLTDTRTAYVVGK